MQPTPITLLIQGDEMTTWYKDLDQAEKVQVGRQSQKVLEYLGFEASLVENGEQALELLERAARRGLQRARGRRRPVAARSLGDPALPQAAPRRSSCPPANSFPRHMFPTGKAWMTCLVASAE